MRKVYGTCWACISSNDGKVDKQTMMTGKRTGLVHTITNTKRRPCQATIKNLTKHGRRERGKAKLTKTSRPMQQNTHCHRKQLKAWTTEAMWTIKEMLQWKSFTYSLRQQHIRQRNQFHGQGFNYEIINMIAHLTMGRKRCKQSISQHSHHVSHSFR